MVKSNSLQQLKPQRIPKLRPLKLRGIRMRKWGKWVSEVRMPNSRGKIWLGSYDTAEQAARAYDFAVYCFRGPHARFNFPISPSEMPSISSLSQREIQTAAANFALRKFPLAPGVKMAAEAETEMLCPVSEIGSAFAQEIISENEEGFWESVLNGNESESEVVKMEMAARAYDFAVYCFRGAHARFNFPISPFEMPSITSLSQREIQAAAANFTLQKFPLAPGVKLATEVETEMLCPVSEIGSSYAQEIVSENEVGFWESVLNGNESESDEVVKMEMAALAHLPIPSPVRVTVDQVE